MTPAEELVAVLARIRADAAVSREVWTGDRLRRLAVAMQWIHAGELARRHCEDHDLPKGTTPWSGLIGFRGVLAHSTESEVDFARVREFSQRDVRDYQRDVAEALGESG